MSTIVIFGAGATKACGGPMTNEILVDAFRERQHIQRENFLGILDQFLVENFHLPPNHATRRQEDYPGLPLLLSLLDTAIDRRHALRAGWGHDRLVDVRDALEYVIFALLDHRLRNIADNHYLRLLQLLKPNEEPTFISLNYDLIADNAIIRHGERSGRLGVPDYGCDIATDAYRDLPRTAKLFKLHGSLNWLYCPGCHRLDVGVSETGRMYKVLNQLYQEAYNRLEDRYSCLGAACRECGANVRPVMVTPTYLKDYRNPHISRTWYEAERSLRQAHRVIFVGYSLPEDDLAVTYLLKRGLSHLHGSAVTAVEFDPAGRGLRENPVGARYRTLFGDSLDWRTEGFGAWLDGHESAGTSPLAVAEPV